MKIPDIYVYILGYITTVTQKRAVYYTSARRAYNRFQLCTVFCARNTSAARIKSKSHACNSSSWAFSIAAAAASCEIDVAFVVASRRPGKGVLGECDSEISNTTACLSGNLNDEDGDDANARIFVFKAPFEDIFSPTRLKEAGLTLNSGYIQVEQLQCVLSTQQSQFARADCSS